ncbi:hypothetical protein [Reyranella sp.]|uniref:hypothetical protein n=1 Tax=Reyranella sp. TaxID=1929291 RepID=UPI00120B5267|nr:hypothetical protein [Reyranella sp.]TAJ82103.1 MAG: hypothetical protein EPO50_27810 [Reyranella sp.]
MEIVGKFIHLKREEDHDLINWYLTVRTFKPDPAEGSVLSRMRTVVDGTDRNGLLKLVESLWISFKDRHRDIWADRFFAVANLHDEFVKFFDCAPPQWMWDTEARKPGRVQYADVHHMHRTTMQAQLRHEAVVKIAAERGIDLDLIGYMAPEVFLPDVERLAENRRQAERERKQAYRSKKAADKVKGQQQVAAIPEETSEAVLRIKLAEALATNEGQKRQIAKFRSQAHLQPAREEAAMIAVAEGAPWLKQMNRMEHEIADLKEQNAELNEQVAAYARANQERKEAMEAEIKRLRADLAQKNKISEAISARIRNPLNLTRQRN